jgi:hypothetical protein
MNYKYARYLGFGKSLQTKYWIKYVDTAITGSPFPGIQASGYAFKNSDGTINTSNWNASVGFFPFNAEFDLFQQIKYKNLPKELKEKAK